MKFETHLQIVRYADEHGIKPAAREFDTTVKTVRKWLRRWLADDRSRRSLVDRSKAPKTCPHKTKPLVEQRVLGARAQAPCFGPKRLKEAFALPVGHSAIARILKQHGLTRRRLKKHEKKRNLLAVKQGFAPFEQLQVDTKYLTDIPYYVAQLQRNPALPTFQYTARDVKTGGLFLGFANELSESHACGFLAAVAAHLERVGFGLKGRLVQTDNGSEFSGAERRQRNDRGFSALVQERLKAHHRFIPPGKKNHQADVETVHHLIELELLDLETYGSRAEFFLKNSAWQLWFNTTRKNGYKGDRTPDTIMLQDAPQRDPRVWMLPALDLDQLLDAHVNSARRGEGKGGYHVPPLPELRLQTTADGASTQPLRHTRADFSI